MGVKQSQSWLQSFAIYLDKRVLSMLFLGFAAGLPYLLIFSNLSIWLKEAGFDIKIITMFSWAMLGYSFKFVWAPLVDAVRLPMLATKLGHRRAWLLLAQLGIIVAIVSLGLVNPVSDEQLTTMAIFAVLLGFLSATQDIVIDAYRIEIADVSLQSAMSATYVMGYRLGLIVGGAGSLFLAEYFGSTNDHYHYQAWQITYLIMAGLMGIGMVTTFLIKEPNLANQRYQRSRKDYLHLFVLFLLGISAFVISYIELGQWIANFSSMTNSPLLKFLAETARLLLSVLMAVVAGFLLIKSKLIDKQVAMDVWVSPIQDFFQRYGKQALLLLLLIGFYRVSDIVAGTTSNLFYLNLGFSKTEIAWAVKTLGIWVAIFGGFVGGLLAERLRIMQAMMVGAILSATTNLLFIWLSTQGHVLSSLYVVVVLDNLASGLANAVFIAFLSALTNIRFTAVQYAIFSSLMTLFPKVLGGYSGAIVESNGFAIFFLITALLSVPVLGLIYWVDKKIMLNQTSNGD